MHEQFTLHASRFTSHVYQHLLGRRDHPLAAETRQRNLPRQRTHRAAPPFVLQQLIQRRCPRRQIAHRQQQARLRIGDGAGNPADVRRQHRQAARQCLDDRQACVDNQCECVGDCNLDGRVRANEITIMVDIINGEAPLSACPAADFSGDGVRANDITIAINNINLGCP